MQEINKILCGNCVEVLNKYEDNCIDLTVFSPPYNDIREYNGFSLNLLELGKQLYRTSKEGGVVCCIINDSTSDFAKSLTSFRLVLDWCDNVGWKLFETVIYSRQGTPGVWYNQRFRVDSEFIFIFFKGDKPKYFNKEHLLIDAKYAGTRIHGTQRMSDGSLVKRKDAPVKDKKCRGTIWNYSTSSTEGNRLKTKHPATFPNKLAFDLIKCFSQENEIVLNPTCGSGTTCVVAENTNRKYIGIDISEEYCKLAEERIKRETIDIFKD